MATRETLIEQERYGRRLYLRSADIIATNDYKLATMVTDAQVISFNAKRKEQSGAYDESR